MKLICMNNNDDNDYNFELDLCGYSNLEPDIKDDIIAVWKFFCNENLVLWSVKHFAEQYYAVNKDEKRTIRQFFNMWGSNNHFNQVSEQASFESYETSPDFKYPDHTPILCGELTADLFHNVLLKQGYLSGDIGAGPVHGKWAHSIQIFMLEEARKTGRLTLHSPTVCEFVKTISQIQPLFAGRHLWDILFDSFDEDVYTYPNNVTDLLTHLNDSEATLFISKKFSAFNQKFTEETKSGDYNALAKKKYLSRISEAVYIKYADQCSLLWFKPKSCINVDDKVTEKQNVSMTLS